MRIIKFRAENIKKLVAVEIVPTGNIVKITGKNKAGKTSVLDAIFWALGGQQNIQEKPIRSGQKKAAVELDLGDIIVKRSFNESGSTALVIENKDGLRFKSPQTMLDGLIGRLSFDPLEFMRMDQRRQFETLRALTGIDTTKLDQQREALYKERTEVNRDAKRLEAQEAGIVVAFLPPVVDEKETDVADLVEQINEAVALQQKRDAIKAKVADADRREGEVMREVAHLNDQISKLKAQLEQQEETLTSVRGSYANLTADYDAITVPDITSIQAEVRAAGEKNKLIRQRLAEFEKKSAEVERAVKEKDRLKAEWLATEAKADDITTAIDTIDQQKAELIGSVQFPVDALGFGNGAVTYNDLPLSQASAAEQLRVSMAMAMSLNPKLHVLRITDGSLLDSESMRIIEEMANDRDYQVWMEVVDESGKVGVYIEDGQVMAVNSAHESQGDNDQCTVNADAAV